MLKPTSLKSIPSYPVTAGVAIMAVVVTALWWSDKNVRAFMMDGYVWQRWELWRGITSALPHVDLIHLIFNLYWFWVFGAVVEHNYGHARFAALIMLLALGSSLAEFTFLHGGVGLSGVGYGLWAMLWVLQKRDSRFAGTVDERTSQLFVSWFFLCIGLTVTNVMPVANIAHGVGALMGLLFGLIATHQGVIRKAGILGITLVLVFGMAGSTVFWPRVNRTEFGAASVEYAGLQALDRNENAHAVKLLTMAAHMKAAPARTWFNLGIAHQRMEQYDEALAAYEHAAGMPGADDKMRTAAQRVREYKEGRQ
jgi:membrane associated rhomboid family serine protease